MLLKETICYCKVRGATTRCTLLLGMAANREATTHASASKSTYIITPANVASIANVTGMTCISQVTLSTSKPEVSATNGQPAYLPSPLFKLFTKMTNTYLCDIETVNVDTCARTQTLMCACKSMYTCSIVIPCGHTLLQLFFVCLASWCALTRITSNAEARNGPPITLLPSRLVPSS